MVTGMRMATDSIYSVGQCTRVLPFTLKAHAATKGSTSNHSDPPRSTRERLLSAAFAPPGHLRIARPLSHCSAAFALLGCPHITEMQRKSRSSTRLCDFGCCSSCASVHFEHRKENAQDSHPGRLATLRLCFGRAWTVRLGARHAPGCILLVRAYAARPDACRATTRRRPRRRRRGPDGSR